MQPMQCRHLIIWSGRYDIEDAHSNNTKATKERMRMRNTMPATVQVVAQKIVIAMLCVAVFVSQDSFRRFGSDSVRIANDIRSGH